MMDIYIYIYIYYILDWRQGPLEDAGRGPQSCARLAAAVTRKNQNWSHMFLGEVLKHRVHVHTNADDDDMMMMVMMMMTLMKLVNSATKFRHGIDKFYQPNSGLRGSKTWDEAIYTYVHIYIYTYTYIHIHVQYMYIIYTYVLCTFHIVAG